MGNFIFYRSGTPSPSSATNASTNAKNLYEKWLALEVKLSTHLQPFAQITNCIFAFDWLDNKINKKKQSTFGPSTIWDNQNTVIFKSIN